MSYGHQEINDITMETSMYHYQNYFDRYLHAQIDEILKYKWCMGVQMCRDPLQDRSFDDIAMEWIRLHAADFRRSWAG